MKIQCAIVTVIGSVVFGVTEGVTSTPAGAEIYTCAPTPASNYFDGFGGLISKFEGVSVYATNPTEQVCDTDTSAFNFSSAWSMVDDSYNGVSQGYIQSGYVRSYGGSDEFFAQKQYLGGNLTTVYGATLSSYGQNHHYWVDCTPSGTCTTLSAIIDSDVFMTLPISDFYMGIKYLFPEAFSEQGYLSSDVPGTASSPLTFSEIQYQLPSGSFTTSLGTEHYENDSGTLSSDCNLEHRWGADSAVSSNTFHVWEPTPSNGSC